MGKKVTKIVYITHIAGDCILSERHIIHREWKTLALKAILNLNRSLFIDVVFAKLQYNTYDHVPTPDTDTENRNKGKHFLVNNKFSQKYISHILLCERHAVE